MSTCQRCDREHITRSGSAACKGHLSRNHTRDPGGPCTKPPMRGQDVCEKHGGLAPQNKAAGARRHAEAKAERLLRRFGGPVDTTPTEALLDTVRWTAGYVEWLREKVAAVPSDGELVWGVTRETAGDVVVGNGASAVLDRAESSTSEAKPNAWLVLLGEWSDRLVRVCKEAINAGIEERRVRLAEQQGQLVADVIRKILGDLELTPEQQQRAGNVIPIRLRELAG